MEQMKKLGRYSVRPYLSAFGSYNNAAQEADLSVNRIHGALNGIIDYGPTWSDQRENALDRDDWTRQEDGCVVTDEAHRDQYGLSLDVHHIRKVRRFDDVADAH